MLYKNKYRAETIRLKNWDYSMSGYYHVTICVKDREHHFGRIENGIMVLSDAGKIADACWREMPHYVPFIKLDEHIIMPNHMHGIVIIENPICRDVIYHVSDNRDTINRDMINHVSTTIKNNPMIHKNSLAYGIRWYKGRVTYEVRKNIKASFYFAWQPKFYESIIRDEEGLNQVRLYIQSNPENWENDEENNL